MPSFKALYGILLSGLVLYFLIYSLIVKKLPVVKIYFEDTRQSEVRLRQDIVYDLPLAANRITNESLTPISEDLSIEEKLHNAAEVTGQKEQDSTVEIFSFLEGLGVPVNKADISPVNIPETQVPPRVNPNGVSLPWLMRKMDRYMNLSADKPCPTGHLRKGKSHLVLLVVFVVFFFSSKLSCIN